jgi:hypothetical protein
MSKILKDTIESGTSSCMSSFITMSSRTASDSQRVLSADREANTLHLDYLLSFMRLL